MQVKSPQQFYLIIFRIKIMLRLNNINFLQAETSTIKNKSESVLFMITLRVFILFNFISFFITWLRSLQFNLIIHSDNKNSSLHIIWYAFCMNSPYCHPLQFLNFSKITIKDSFKLHNQYRYKYFFKLNLNTQKERKRKNERIRFVYLYLLK